MRLSYSTCREIIEAPHTFYNWLEDMPRIKRDCWEQGKNVHRIVQDSVSGIKPHPLLKNLPEFDMVETCDKDKKMEINFKYGKYDLHGYVDLIDTKRNDFGDIKSGSSWSIAQIINHPQFLIYAHALKMHDFWLINLPKLESEWKRNNIKVSKVEFTDKQIKKMEVFLDKAIDIIENIGDYVAKEDFSKTKWSCNYVNCPWCKK